ncbi:Pol protein, partial [Phytophthora palmivora]
MDMAVKFEDFNSTESFLVLNMDKYDLILGMPLLEKHEPWIDWRGKPLGLAGPQSPTELWRVMFPPLFGTGASEKVAKVLMRPKNLNADSSRAVWASTVVVPDSSDQAGNIGPQAAEAAEESAESVSCVGNIGPQAAEAAEEDAESASGVGNIVPRKIEETKKKNESAACVSSVGNEVPRGVNKTNTRVEVSLSTSRVDNQVPHSESETPPARPVVEHCHVFDGVSGRQVRAGAVHLEALPEVSALRNLEGLSMKDFLAELKAGEIAEMMGILEPKQLFHIKEYSDVVSKHPPSQLAPYRRVRHEIDLMPGTKYCVTRQWPLPREQCEVINAFFAEKANSVMVRESKSPHSTPTFCVRKPNGKW